MKTNEFIKEVEEMGFVVKEGKNFLNVFRNEVYVAIIDKKRKFSMDTNCKEFGELNEYNKQKLFNLLTKYVSTSIEERGKEKKYMYCVKSIKGVTVGSEFLNYDYYNKTWEINDEYDNDIYKTVFTHSWLKEHGVDIKQLKEVYEEIEVEGDIIKEN